MDLGKIFTVSQFNKNEQTTWIIDKFYKNIFTEEVYDTVNLGGVLSIIENDIVYPISLFIKKYVPECETLEFNSRSCGTTFSSLKRKYVGRGFDVNACDKDILLNKIYDAYLFSKTKESDMFVEFDSPFCFKAQDSYDHESAGFGRSWRYYIVGISVGKSFEVPKRYKSRPSSDQNN